MTAKYHRNNTNFQIAYFLAGKCHTPDAAYIELLNLKEERENAIKSAETGKIRQQASLIKIQRRLKSDDEVDRIEAQADLEQFNHEIEFNDKLLLAAKDELKFIEECIDRLQPHRLYAHLPDIEAAEACQKDEWLLELKTRCENYMLTTGTIPTDHFAAMRLHPEFNNKLLPYIEQTQDALRNEDGHRLLLERTTAQYDLPKLLGFESNTNDNLSNH